jgi:predicted ester cyclase
MSIQENKEFIRRYNEVVWNGHNIEIAREFVPSDQSLEHVEQFLTAFPDAHIIIHDLIAEGDKVVARLHVSATNTGPFAGKPPTGKKIEFQSIRIYRIADNKIVETWAMQDRLGLMEQLGLVQSTGGNVNWASGDED